MRVIKRNGSEVDFDTKKISAAIAGANNDIMEDKRVSQKEIDRIAEAVTLTCINLGRAPSVEEIQDMVETELMKYGAFDVAKEYITYRYKRALVRQSNTTDEKILSLINRSNEEAKQENANKNPIINSTQRDYMAGEVSKDITRRILMPKEIMEAHDLGIIHFHDSDYFAQREHNCDLIDLNDMLQNGTVISGTMIEKPHSFYTACNITTQIIAQVASNQYGGQSFSLAHLAPFVDISRQKIKKSVMSERRNTGESLDEDTIKRIVDKRLREEIRSGIQTVQYQLITLMTCNGQAPFVTMFMYLDEVPEGQLRDDLAMCIEEVLCQRYQGVKNEQGIWITPAFPKLIYVLDEDNITEDAPYYYLTELAAQCSAKRLVPDYISAKVMKELKQGEVYPCMGCVDGQEIITYKLFGIKYTESFERAWDRIRCFYPVKTQADGVNKYIDCDNVEILDTKKGFVKCYRFIRNQQDKWLQITIDGGRTIRVTEDHPFETENRGIVLAKDLNLNDIIFTNKNENLKEINGIAYDTEKAWLLGMILCDGCYDKHVFISIANQGEDDIEKKFSQAIFNHYELNTNTIIQERGNKGVYKDIYVASDGTNKIPRMCAEFYSLFEGRTKTSRHVPNEVYNWNEAAKLSFLAGMIDADGYLNKDSSVIQIGSTNKELALGQMYLANSLGMNASIYENHYRSNCKDKIRYRVEFKPSIDLVNLLCEKKKAHFAKSIQNAVSDYKVRKIDFYEYPAYSYDVTTESEHFEVSGIYSHNCRSFLTVEDNYMLPDGHHKFYGRFNQGVVTINLVDVACSSYGDMDKFWDILDERLELCHRALRLRHERLLGTPSDVAPILWQHGAIARLEKGEVIDKLLYNGYSTISLGYAGLCEMCYRMIGESHTTEKGREFALAVMQKLNDKCAFWKANENISYSVYGTPMESTTYKFAKCLQQRFGIIPHVTDKNYITNSYHVHVTEEIDAFTKLKFEADFQKLSPGGAISYVEVPNMQDNLPAVIDIIKYIYDNIMYAELNTKSDYCSECGYDGEIKIVEDSGKLVWECPNCGNRNQDTMSVARRTCGYIGTQYFNQGRTAEIRDRVLHVG